MVEKDVNHPSVILYSVGNEISETAQERGIRLSKELAEYMRTLDDSRPVTCGINLFLNGLVSKGVGIYSEDGDGLASQAAAGKETEALAGSAFFNYLMEHLGAIKNIVSLAPFADRATREAFACYDVCGYNYGSARYKKDGKKYKDRLIVGSETYIPQLYDNWKKVEKYPYLIGDFVWTSWDYLGEAGIGTWRYGNAGFAKPYPMLSAGSGTIGLTGKAQAQMAYARVCYGLATELSMAVRPVHHSGETCVKSPWRMTDAVESWSWEGCEGREALVEIYTDAPLVKLYINGRAAGKGRPKKGICRFTLPWEPGVLRAESYGVSGEKIGQRELWSASGKKRLYVSVESCGECKGFRADGQSLAYLDILVADERQIPFVLTDVTVSVRVEGAGVLQGLGTDRESTEETYIGHTCTTYLGRAQAVIRSGYEPGEIKVTVSAEGYEDRSVRLEVGRC